MTALRVIYLGTPEFAVPGLRALLASPHEVVALISQPDRPRGRGHKVTPTPTKLLAATAGVKVLQPTRLKDHALHEQIHALEPDLGVVAAYGRIIPDVLLEIPRHGMINIHASLLPKYRGAAPVHRAVIAGEPETGVTIMRVVSELDAGPTFADVRRQIGPNETTPEVERSLAELGGTLMVDVVNRIADGRAVETPQDDSRATYAPKIERHEGVIDWTLPAWHLHNLVRGLQPWPLVTIVLGGAPCRVHRTLITDLVTDRDPGTVVAAAAGVIAIAAGDRRVLHITEIQPEGKRVMSAREFLAGHRIVPGTAITSRL